MSKSRLFGFGVSKTRVRVSFTLATTGSGVRAELPREGDPGVGEELPAGCAGRRHRADHAAVREDAHQRVHHGLLPPAVAAAGMCVCKT